MSQHASILPAHTPALFDAAVKRAAELLRAGEVVALPTETVYGLAANALNAAAVRRIFAVKQRPARNPVIVHVNGVAMARRCVAEWPDTAGRLAAAFWPGPLTLVLPRSNEIPDEVTAGGATVGVRWPGHPLMQAVIRECGFPLAAPSANRANEVSPTTAAHVQNSLGERIPLIVDGGQSQVGIESAVLDISVWPPRVLRPGMIHEESLVAVLGASAAREAPVPTLPEQECGMGTRGTDLSSGTLRSPGLLNKHYAPRAPLLVLSWHDDSDLQSQLAGIAREWRVEPDHAFIISHTRVPAGGSFGQVSVIPHDTEAFARAIYSELRRCDAEGAQLIVVEAVPATPEWAGIADRLKRASGFRGGD